MCAASLAAFQPAIKARATTSKGGRQWYGYIAHTPDTIVRKE